MIRRILLCAVALLLSCSSAEKLSSIDYSLASINAAVEGALSMGILKYSENRRVVYSKPFVVTQDTQARKSGYRERGRAIVWVLGDIRPYTIEAEVTIERAKITVQNIGQENYEPVRKDKELARKILNKITTLLQKRENKRNVIDDFRPF